MTPLDVRIGSMIAGYRIDGLLGRGGMGVVYRAEHLRLHRPVALKLLAPEIAEDERFRARFLRESELAASIDHPNIIPIYDAGEEDGLLYIAMRHVGGTDLRTVLRETGRLSPERAVTIIRQIAEALDHAHSHGLVHRDVKPGNILVVSDPADHCYLCDFGLTKSANSIADPASSGHLAGTVDYVAPEQITGAGADARSDLYSLACVAWECLTGAPPFHRDSDLATLWAHVNDAPPQIDPALDLPPGVEKTLQRALSKHSADRQGTCREVAAALSDAFAGATRAVVTETAPAAPRRSRTKVAIGVLAALAIAAVAALGLWSTTRPSGTPAVGHVQRAPTPVPNAIVQIDASSMKQLGSISLDRSPGPILATAAGLWVAGEGARKLWLIDPNTGELVTEVSLGGTPTGLAAQGDGVWVVEGLHRQLEHFNPEGEPTKTFSEAEAVCCPGPWSVAAGDGTLWIGVDNSVRLIDPTTGEVVPLSDQPTSSGSRDLEAVQGGAGEPDALWTADGWARVYRVRQSGAARPTLIRVPDGSSDGRPVAVAADSHWLWIAAEAAHQVFRISLRGSPQLSPYPTDLGLAQPTALTVGAGAVWVASAKSGEVWKIDQKSRKVLGHVKIHLRIKGIAVSGGKVWITTGGSLTLAQPTAALAYQGSDGIDFTGPGLRGLPHIPGATMPAWSPDGTKLAYVSGPSIYIANWDGSEPVRLTGDDSAPATAPSWSPDGTEIAYASRDHGTWDVWTVQADGGNALPCEPAADDTAFDSFPDYSPDGQTIAFLSDRDGTRAVFTTNADCTGEPAAVLDAVSGMGAPSWSPDGTALAFWSNDNDGIVMARPVNHVYTVARIAVTGRDPVHVSWSPDGSYIAYSAPTAGHGHTIYVMYADGTGRHALTKLGNAQFPAWRPSLR